MLLLRILGELGERDKAKRHRERTRLKTCEWRCTGYRNTGKVDALAYLQGQLIAAGHISKPLDVSRLPDNEARRLEKCLNGLLSKAAVSLTMQ